MTTNKYCQALAELRAKPTHELKEVGDQWRTPDLLFWGINAMFGPLVLDLFADDHNAKCPAWYTAEDNALTQDWSERLIGLGGAAFGNPPYSRSQYHEKQAITGMSHIMKYAADMREKGGRYVFLIKAAPSETWWPEDADHIVFIRGRIGFDLPEWFVPADEKQQPTSAFFAGAIVVFDKAWSGERFSYIHRSDLEAKGRAFMALAQFAAKKVSAPVPEATEPVIPQVNKPVEVELPLTQKGIFERSGVEVWACVRAAFGDKDAYTFSESKFGHTWAADSVESPELTQVSPMTIDKAKQLIRENILVGLNDWLESLQFDDQSSGAEIVERFRTVALEFSSEYGMSSDDFLLAVGSLKVEKWSNIRQIRAHVRSYVESEKPSEAEQKIYPLEVSMLFDELPGADTFDQLRKEELKGHIQSRWLERASREDILNECMTMIELSAA